MTSLYFSFQARLTRLRNTGKLLPWEYGRDIGPDEYQQVLGELFKQTNGWTSSSIGRPRYHNDRQRKL
jgi:hypothetical protein